MVVIVVVKNGERERERTARYSRTDSSNGAKDIDVEN
jgi:hypothetical protein